ncbi:MAG: hypothetical protein H8E13_12290 [Actinobacteria bacterium]|nr:hypothetical protein [Actinomycetota bacterium]
MKKQINLLECKMCGYKAKSLHQHIKAIHKISSKEYRNIYGQNCILQIGFIPPASRPKINKKYSNYVKQGYKNQREKLKKIMNFYSKEETKKILLKNKK